MKTVAKMGAVIAAASIILILILISIEVLLRPFKASLLFTGEVVGYLNIAVIFCGMTHAMRSGSFIRLDVLYLRLRGGARDVAKMAIAIAGILFFGLILYYASTYAVYSYTHGLTSIGMLQLPAVIPQAVIVVGIVMVLGQLFVWALERLRNLP